MRRGMSDKNVMELQVEEGEMWRRLLSLSILSIFVLVILGISISACEKHHESTFDTSAEPPQIVRQQDQYSPPTRANLYDSARHAARRGDFQLAQFHLQAAASAGYADELAVRAEPLFRPLHSGPRWSLVLDLIRNNCEQTME